MPWVNYTIKCNSSCREIARLIGRNVSTVSREIRRNCTHMYDLPAHSPEEISAAPFLLPSRDVPLTGSD
ncbi:MAG TPA: helix-turn-helix domain-containing protein [Candidatus Scatomorpha gallistercoris]|nr:helix-turn-helix domain-containing protein [Candidatus Scatomorpha gallistercoris]